MLKWPTSWSERPKNRPNAGNGQLCKFHNEYGHGTDECHHLRDELERLERENRLTKYVANTYNLERKQGQERYPEKQRDDRRAPALPPPPPRLPRGGNPTIQTIHMIMGGHTEGDSGRARRKSVESVTEWRGEVHHIFEDIGIGFGSGDSIRIQSPHTDALVIRAHIGGYNIERVFIDTESSVDVMFVDCFKRMGLKPTIEPVATSLFGFAGESVRVTGRVEFTMTLGEEHYQQSRTIKFILVDAPSQYNVILGRHVISEFVAVISMAHLMMKFPVEDAKQRVIGVEVVRGDQQMARKCYVQSVRTLETYKRAGDGRREEDVEVERKRRKEGESKVAEYEPGELLTLMIDPRDPEKKCEWDSRCLLSHGKLWSKC